MHWLNGSVFAPIIQCDVMNRVVVYIFFFIIKSLYYVKVIFESMELGAGMCDVVSLERA